MLNEIESFFVVVVVILMWWFVKMSLYILCIYGAERRIIFNFNSWTFLQHAKGMKFYNYFHLRWENIFNFRQFKERQGNYSAEAVKFMCIWELHTNSFLKVLQFQIPTTNCSNHIDIEDSSIFPMNKRDWRQQLLSRLCC